MKAGKHQKQSTWQGSVHQCLGEVIGCLYYSTETPRTECVRKDLFGL